jgi:hypothetical protein
MKELSIRVASAVGEIAHIGSLDDLLTFTSNSRALLIDGFVQ